MFTLFLSLSFIHAADCLVSIYVDPMAKRIGEYHEEVPANDFSEAISVLVAQGISLPQLEIEEELEDHDFENFSPKLKTVASLYKNARSKEEKAAIMYLIIALQERLEQNY